MTNPEKPILRPSARYYIITILLFVGFGLVGYALAGNKAIAQAAVTAARAFFAHINGDGSSVRIFLGLLFNNGFKAFLLILTGFFFWIFPFVFSVSNGLVLGLLIRIATDAGAKVSVLLAALLPHGVLELPAVFIATAYSFWLGTHFVKKLWRKEAFQPYLVASLRAYGKVIFPMLVLAAIIETFVTPLVIKWVMDA